MELIRRPLVLPCLSFAGGMCFDYGLYPYDNKAKIFVIIVLSIFSIAAGLIYRYKSRNQKRNSLNFDTIYKKNAAASTYACLSVCFVLGAFMFHIDFNYETDLEKQIGQYMEIQGQILEIYEKEPDYHYMVLKTRGRHREKIRVTLTGELEEFYDFQGKSVSLKGFVEKPQHRRNPNCFDYANYLKTKNINVVMTTGAKGMTLCEEDKLSAKLWGKYLNSISRIKNTFKENIYEFEDENVASLLMGMVFGDRSGIEDDIYDKFQKNGACHILAVSGLHIGALYGCILLLCGGKLTRKQKLAAVAILMFYCSLASFAPSVIRAATMILIHMISDSFGKRYDMFQTSCITMAIMLAYNPCQILNLGFQLSFIAIYTIALLLPAITRFTDNIFVKSVGIQAGMIPVSAWAFNYFSFSALFVNIPIVFLGGMVIPAALLMLACIILSMVSGSFCSETLAVIDFLYHITGIVAEFFCKLILFLNEAAYIKDFSYIYAVSPTIGFMCFYYGALSFLSSEYFRLCIYRKLFKRIGYIIFFILMISLSCNLLFEKDFQKASAVFIDVGQGDCLAIKTEGGKTVLIDSGGSSTKDIGKDVLMPYLLKNGFKKVDVAVLTHLHQDHAGGLYSLAREIPVNKLVLYEGNKVLKEEIEKKTGINAENYIYLSKDQRLKFDEETWIDVIYPEKDANDDYEYMKDENTDENLSSLVMIVHVDGMNILMTGDIDEKCERKIVESGALDSSDEYGNKRKINVLKVAHHGSKYSSAAEFLNKVDADVFVIQVGKNTYGHPSRQTLERLQSSGAPIYRTDKQGAIGMYTNGKGELCIMHMI